MLFLHQESDVDDSAAKFEAEISLTSRGVVEIWFFWWMTVSLDVLPVVSGKWVRNIFYRKYKPTFFFEFIEWNNGRKKNIKYDVILLKISNIFLHKIMYLDAANLFPLLVPQFLK